MIIIKKNNHQYLCKTKTKLFFQLGIASTDAWLSKINCEIHEIKLILNWVSFISIKL